MLLLAATALEKLHNVPSKVWINFGIGVLVFVVVVIVLRKAAQMNKVLLGAIIFVVLTIVGFNWVYSRNEPQFLTPFVEKIAPFFPSSASKAKKADRFIPQ